MAGGADFDPLPPPRVCYNREPMLTLAYIALIGLGGGYVVVSVLLGQLFDFGDHAGTTAGHDAPGSAASGDYGSGGHGHAAAGELAAPSFHFPFFSPLALATLFAAIGSYGLLAKFGLRVGDSASLAIALPAALATTYGVTFAAWRLITSSQASSSLRTAQFVGATGEVMTPIPVGGLGEVAALVDGQRFVAPAREVQGKAVARGTAVKIVSMTGATLLVKVEPEGSN